MREYFLMHWFQSTVISEEREERMVMRMMLIKIRISNNRHHDYPIFVPIAQFLAHTFIM